MIGEKLCGFRYAVTERKRRASEASSSCTSSNERVGDPEGIRESCSFIQIFTR